MDSTSILINIRKIIRSVNLESKRIQKEFGLSIPQLLALNYLNQCDDYKCTHSELAKYLNLNSSTLTGIITRLVKKGWVAKIPNQKDRRVTYITLTAEGMKLLKNAPQLMHQRLSQKLEKLSQEKLEELERAFDLLVEFMEIEGVEASALLTIDELNPPSDLSS
ncbi:MarR family transcriptional regulator [Fulvivirga sp. RKSG066]|uniref:MarR family winged helix-turn-helix transcriptional regulator n=1 Tax=Fulvivirga aurantia TaxID=2529383 RepID=UPI0012BCDD92|nr:MarR family transcriptional regulator [Fulvivirga aurantia]MTI20319.1 MarR family transcriptional regulator [Fulvivirga aurantia]